jgi:hypothetical protein
MEVNVIINSTITKQDYQLFHLYSMKRLLKGYAVWSFFKNAAVWLFFVIVLVSFFGHLSSKKPIIDWHTAFTLALPIFLYLLAENLLHRAIKKNFQPKDNGIMLGPKEFELTDVGIKEKHALGYCFYHWRAVDAVEEHNGAVYIFVDTATALIIPALAFTSEVSKADFLAVTHHHLKQGSRLFSAGSKV